MTHWSQMSQTWGEVMPPLKPSAENLEFYRQAAYQVLGSHPNPTIVILGVTPGLHNIPWPDQATIMAIDKNPDMIANVWPGKPENAYCADWSNMPLPENTADVFLCDGGIICLTHPSIQAVAKELQRVARPQARVITRIYVPTPTPESPDEVLNALAQGQIPNLSQFKLRIAIAMQTDPEQGVVLADIWDTLQAFAPDRDALAKRAGWRKEHLDAIDSYRGSTDIYRFPTIDQVEQIFKKEGWTLAQSAKTEDPRCVFAVFDRSPS